MFKFGLRLGIASSGDNSGSVIAQLMRSSSVVSGSIPVRAGPSSSVEVTSMVRSAGGSGGEAMSTLCGVFCETVIRGGPGFPSGVPGMDLIRFKFHSSSLGVGLGGSDEECPPPGDWRSVRSTSRLSW